MQEIYNYLAKGAVTNTYRKEIIYYYGLSGKYPYAVTSIIVI